MKFLNSKTAYKTVSENKKLTTTLFICLVFTLFYIRPHALRGNHTFIFESLFILFSCICLTAFPFYIEAYCLNYYNKADEKKKFTKWMTSRFDFIYVATGFTVALGYVLFLSAKKHGINISENIQEDSKFIILIPFCLRLSKALFEMRDNAKPRNEF